MQVLEQLPWRQPFPTLALVLAIVIEIAGGIAMAGGLLQIVAFGAGRFSLDARRR